MAKRCCKPLALWMLRTPGDQDPGIKLIMIEEQQTDPHYL